jgi:hypothetical protein
MDLETLKNTSKVDELLSDHLRALWYDQQGDWDAAHSIVQHMEDLHAMWIHAHLHRKEPDIWNAKYWYRKVGKPYPGEIPFDQEAATILEDLMNQYA